MRGNSGARRDIGIPLGVITWKERWPFSLLFHGPHPAAGGLCAAVAVWLFGFWVLALLVSKMLLPEGGWSGLLGLSSNGNGKLPNTCSRYGAKYGLQLDAGSTGSRIHAYQFTFETDGSVTLHHELFEQVKPGLSAFKGRPADAAASIDGLVQKAVKYVPEGLHACTPIELKATAGLRLIGPEASEELLRAVEATFHRSGFYVPPNAAIVMDGKDEGPMAWITVNFLLGTLFEKSKKDQHHAQRHMPHSAHLSGTPRHPVAILDMGGASTQIVFVPFGDSSKAIELPPEQHYRVKLFGRSYEMYQHSHLGYGLKEAGKSIARSAVDKNAFECFPPGGEYMLDAGKGVKVSNRNNAVQSYTICSQYVRRFLNKRQKCRHSSCSFNGVYQPSLAEHFKGGDFYIFSYFYDRMEPFLPDSGIMTVGDFKKYGRKICDSYSKKEADLSGEDLVAHKRNLGTECMDFAFLYEILATGYDLPDEQTVHIRKKINGVETAWTLGAMLNTMQ